jgi:hypothetical protein
MRLVGLPLLVAWHLPAKSAGLPLVPCSCSAPIEKKEERHVWA